MGLADKKVYHAEQMTSIDLHTNLCDFKCWMEKDAQGFTSVPVSVHYVNPL